MLKIFTSWSDGTSDHEFLLQIAQINTDFFDQDLFNTPISQITEKKYSYPFFILVLLHYNRLDTLRLRSMFNSVMWYKSATPMKLSIALLPGSKKK
jgi:hypothetical protein